MKMFLVVALVAVLGAVSYVLLTPNSPARTTMKSDEDQGMDEKKTEAPLKIPEDATRYTVDTAASTVEWMGEKTILQTKETGTIEIKSGDMYLSSDKKLVVGQVIIDMSSLKNNSLGDSPMSQKLDDHLKSADFFDVKKYPTATLTITSVSPTQPNAEPTTEVEIKGRLTIKGITQDITFPATITPASDDQAPESVKVTAHLVLDRSKFDVRFGSQSFFADIGDKVIGDDMTLDVNLTLNKGATAAGESMKE